MQLRERVTAGDDGLFAGAGTDPVPARGGRRRRGARARATGLLRSRRRRDAEVEPTLPAPLLTTALACADAPAPLALPLALLPTLDPGTVAFAPAPRDAASEDAAVGDPVRWPLWGTGGLVTGEVGSDGVETHEVEAREVDDRGAGLGGVEAEGVALGEVEFGGAGSGVMGLGVRDVEFAGVQYGVVELPGLGGAGDGLYVDLRSDSGGPGQDDDFGDLGDTAEWTEGLGEAAAGGELTPSLIGLEEPLRSGSLPASASTEVPDPARLVTDPPRSHEAVVAAVLATVGSLVAWGLGTPSEAWAPITAIPAIGLFGIVLPGGPRARALRAAALLVAAALLPLTAPDLAPVTLVIALAVGATYPNLLGPLAGRTVVVLAALAPAFPLLAAVLGDPRGTALEGPTRLVLGSGILAVLLVGTSTLAVRRALTGTASLAVSRDRTARMTAARLERIVGCDPATGLPGREAARRALTLMLTNDQAGTLTNDRAGEQPNGQGGHAAVVLIEIDRFTALADGLGADLADAVADQVGVRIRSGQPAGRLVVRLGRSQFALVVDEATAAACEAAARAVTVLLTEPFGGPSGQVVTVTCSMGAALSGPGLRTAGDLLQAADESVRAAMRTGRARWVLFDPAVRFEAHRRAVLEGELREAVELGLIGLTYQPLLALGDSPDAGIDDRIVGAEALPVWTRADGSPVDPAHFLPLADELGLAPELGLQLVDQALDALVAWRHEGAGVDQVWINLTRGQLDDPGFAHELLARLAVRGLAAASVVVEVDAAEGLGEIAETEPALATLSLLRSLGVAVALDGFGRSGTSLSALRRLPVSAVKLDPRLADELGQADALPRSVTQLCHALGLRVVADGVRTALQLQGARDTGADAAQGHAIARAMSAEDVTNLLTLRLPRAFRLP